jgi:hypothetical protein
MAIIGFFAGRGTARLLEHRPANRCFEPKPTSFEVSVFRACPQHATEIKDGPLLPFKGTNGAALQLSESRHWRTAQHFEGGNDRRAGHSRRSLQHDE